MQLSMGFHAPTYMYLKPTHRLSVIVDIDIITRSTQFVILIVLIHYALYEAGSATHIMHILSSIYSIFAREENLGLISVDR